MKGLARFPARFPWGAAFCVVLLGLWQGSGLLPAAGHNHVFPTPWAIIRQWVMDWPLYRVHAGATLYRALAGFALGAGVAFPIAVLFCISPLAERLMREINIAILTMPAIVAAPLLALVFSGNTPQILLAALLSYYPCMTATLLGLRAVDPRWLDLVSAYGGGPATAFRLVRLRACLPGFLSGLNGALPVALMGAVLGELGSGADPGLGSFLLNALGQANTARLWGIGLTVAALSLGGYMVLAWVQRHISNVQPVTMMTAQDTAPPVRHVPSWLVATGAVILPFALWGAGVRLAHLSPIIAPGPLHVLHSLTAGPQGAEMRHALLVALGQTLPTAAFGLGCGTLFAFMLAAVESLLPGLSRVILPLTLVVQNMPVIAIIPLIVSIAGRTTTAAVVVAVLVTFFPAYVILSHGFRHAPQAAIELVQAYGGGTGRAFRIVRLPVARGCVFTAMKLAMPQALLGVMVAEWLMTGTGLGNLLNEARSELDEDTVWAGSLVSIMISAAIYHLLSLTERHFAPGRQHSER